MVLQSPVFSLIKEYWALWVPLQGQPMVLQSPGVCLQGALAEPLNEEQIAALEP